MGPRPSAASVDATIPTAAWHLPTLDGVRAIAILSVVVGHVLLARESPGTEDLFGTTFAAFGVSMFFTLSGFLITSLLLREEQRSGRVDIAGFYGRRFLRIFPAYFAYILTVLALDRTGTIDHVTLHDYVASAFFARNLIGHSAETAHLWSLSLEEQFYLLWPTAIALSKPRKRATYVCVAILAITAWRVIVISRGWYSYGALYERTDLRFDTILAGCLLAIVGVDRIKIQRNRAGAAAACALLSFAFAGAAIVQPTLGSVTYPLLIVFLATTLALAVGDRGSLGVALSSRVLGFIGRISYSLYLWQQLFLAPPRGHLAWLRNFPLSIAASFGAALLSYLIIERPIVHWKNAWSARRAARALS